MRILHHLITTGHGGDALSALLLAGRQQDLGHHVEIVIESSTHSAQFVERCRAEGMRCTEMPRPTGHPVVARLRLMSRRRRAMRGAQADVLHFHEGGALLGSDLVVAGRLVGIPVQVATLHAGRKWADPLEAPISDPRRRIWVAVSRLLDTLICPSEVGRNTQHEAGVRPEQIAVLPNPIDLEHFAKGDGARVRAELGLAADASVILYASRLAPEKRPADAVRAFAGALADDPTWHLLMAGEGPMLDECRAAAVELGVEERVAFLGHRTDIPDLLDLASMFVLPTVMESFGLAIAEAMVACVPIVTTTALIAAGVLRPEGDALICPVGDVPAFVAAIEALVNEPELAARLAASAREHVARFDATEVARRHVELYEKVGGRRLARRQIQGPSSKDR
jgi:glycosyltransferase involved in cell wall biosynthesis